MSSLEEVKRVLAEHKSEIRERFNVKETGSLALLLGVSRGRGATSIS